VPGHYQTLLSTLPAMGTYHNPKQTLDNSCFTKFIRGVEQFFSAVLFYG
jgi:hypothetical protein